MPDNLESQPAPAPGGSFGGGTGNGTFTTTSSPEPEPLMGTVTLELEQGMFQVRLDNGTEVRAHLSGTARTTLASIKWGRRVLVDVSPYDAGRGRILGRI